MRAMVTGGAGFIGSHIVDALVENGDEVVVVDDYSTGSMENVHVAALQAKGDIRDDSWIKDMMWWFRPEVVLHYAAQPGLLKSLEDPKNNAEVNVIGTLNVLAGCAKAHVQHVIFPSTGAVYDPTGPTPYLEDAPKAPLSPYGASKLAAEIFLTEWQERTDIPVTILRLGNVYGPRQKPIGENQVVPRLMAWVFEGKDFKLFGGGLHERDYVYVRDVAAANIAACQSRCRGAYNVSTGIGTSTRGVVELFLRVIGKELEVESVPYPTREHESIVLDTNKAKRDLGWRAGVSLECGMGKTLNAASLYRAHV